MRGKVRTSKSTLKSGNKIVTGATQSKGRVEMLAVTDNNLVNLNEAQLLMLVLTEYALTHPNENPDRAFASALHCDISSIKNWKSGQGFAGHENWLVLERIANTDVYLRWQSLKRTAKQ